MLDRDRNEDQRDGIFATAALLVIAQLIGKIFLALIVAYIAAHFVWKYW